MHLLALSHLQWDTRYDSRRGQEEERVGQLVWIFFVLFSPFFWSVGSSFVFVPSFLELPDALLEPKHTLCGAFYPSARARAS